MVKPKKRTQEQERSDEDNPPPKKVKTARCTPLVHDVEIREEVEDAINEEIPPTQFPVPNSKGTKRRETRASAAKRSAGPPTKKSTSKMASTAAASSSSKSAANVSLKSAANEFSKSAANVSSKPRKEAKQTIFLTQKRKDNIASSFKTSLANKGITEELRRTKRYV